MTPRDYSYLDEPDPKCKECAAQELEKVARFLRMGEDPEKGYIEEADQLEKGIWKDRRIGREEEKKTRSKTSP